jgi:hypothetical protein
MNTTLCNEIRYVDERAKFFRDTFCTVGTQEGNIIECIIDIYAHELVMEDGEILYAHKPVNPEIEVNGQIEHIVSIYTPRFLGDN